MRGAHGAVLGETWNVANFKPLASEALARCPLDESCRVFASHVLGSREVGARDLEWGGVLLDRGQSFPYVSLDL